MSHRSSRVCASSIVPYAAALLLLGGCAAQTASKTAPAVPPAAAGPQHFAEPRAAVEALLAACGATDVPAAMSTLFGPEGARSLGADEAAARDRCDRFVRSAREMTRLDPWGDDRLVLVVGNDDFPLPVPLVKDAQGWSWDAAAGAKEILRRRIGANELAAIALCRAAVQKTRRPLPPPSRGYVFQAFAAKGKTAPAFVAYPTQYGTTGLMTFVVDRGGDVYQKDLGAKTQEIATAMKGEKLDSTWTKTDD